MKDFLANMMKVKRGVSEANPIKEYATNIGVVGIANLLVRLSSLILLPILTKVSEIERNWGKKDSWGRCL